MPLMAEKKAEAFARSKKATASSLLSNSVAR
jgi:hypothetical protein